MKKIDVNLIYRMNLKEIKPSMGGSESKIYSSGDMIYKIYRDRNYLGEKLIYDSDHKKKLEILSSLKDLEQAILPIDMLVSKGAFMSLCRGYSMDKIKDYISLYDLCEDSYRDREIYEGIMNTSKAMESIHNRPENIILSDANFSNVLMEPNENGKYVLPRFSDFDSVLIEGVKVKQVNVPNDLIKFYMDRDNYIKASDIDKNTDRLYYLLQFLKVIFGFDIYEIKMEEFDKLSEEMKSLKTIRKIVLELRDLNKEIPYIPYLHEILSMDEEDAFTRRYEIMF